MRKYTAISAIIFCLCSLLFVYSKTRVNYSKNKASSSSVKSAGISVVPSSAVTIRNNEVVQSLFVPYWALDKSKTIDDNYAVYYYFGIAADSDGSIQKDAGYTNLDYFECPKQSSCILVLRMTDEAINKEILSNTASQQKLINNSIRIAIDRSFSGVALDLETSGLFNAEIKGQINDFVQHYYTSLEDNYKSFSCIVYGDIYYRKRPFDLKFIGEHCDGVMLMAYDFSKSYGEPGPNFPFDTGQIYGYDFKQMIKDVGRDVPKEKITVIFGMYGYDWTLNEQGTPLKRAEAVTINQITQILNSKIQNPRKSQIPDSKEKKIEYVDSEGQRHVIWYEDEESVQVKTDYLKEQGIGKVSYWAYGYF